MLTYWYITYLIKIIKEAGTKWYTEVMPFGYLYPNIIFITALIYCTIAGIIIWAFVTRDQ